MTRVLIVDDEPRLLSILKEFLEPRGFQVWTAGTGEAALQLLQAHQPHVLLLDLTLGSSGLQGVDVLKQTKAVSPATRVMVISANTDEAKKAEVLQLGAVKYLEKPLNLQVLLDTLHEVTAPSAPL